MLAKPKPNSTIRRKMHAEFESRATIVKRPKVEITGTIPPRRVIALQVKNGRDPKWGSIKYFEIADKTSDMVKDEYKAELAKNQVGWIVNGYFGSDAQFRISEVLTKERKYTYYL